MTAIALLHDYVTQASLAHPDETALVYEGQRMSYRQLDDRSDHLARRLSNVGSQGDRVCLMAAKGISAIVGIIGTLKAGRVYVPIDVTSPVARIAKIVRSADAAWLLVDGAGSRVLADLVAMKGIGDVAVDRLGESGSGQDGSQHRDRTVLPSEDSWSAGSPEDPAYIMFTSGSTGDPKGVVVSHANVICFADWAVRYFGMDRSDRHSGHAPLHFDLSVLDIFATFAAGAELHLVPPALNLLPDKLLGFIRSSRLTQWFSVPTTLTSIAKHARMAHPDLPSLKRIMSCGEVLPTRTVIHWMERVPHASFTNLYGPTETTVASSYHTFRDRPLDPTAPVPIGVACDGEELLVLDADLRRVPPGEPGELYVGGGGVGLGYWGDPQRTGRAYVPHPFSRDGGRIYRTGDIAKVDLNGVHRFLGRRDSQVKSRGYRIELGEIESALRSMPGLSDCAVIAVRADGSHTMRICCAVVATAGHEIEAKSLRKELSELLSSYMLPIDWRVMERLPRNANGKVDRIAVEKSFEGVSP